MGSLKDQMFERSGLRIRFGCATMSCGEVIEEAVEDASFDHSAESIGDGVDVATTTVRCPSCERDYTVHVVAYAGSKSVQIEDIPDLLIEYPADTYTEFLQEYEPDAPYMVYKTSFSEVLDLDFGSEIYPSGRQAFYKMLFLQYVIIMETYLSDRLIKIVGEDPAKMLALVGATEALREMKTPLIALAGDPNYLRKTVKDYLQRFSFHNLPDVAKFYRAVLKIDLFADEANREQLVNACITRHHLAHRNGVDNDGNKIKIDDAAVQHLRTLVEGIVARVEDAYVKYAGGKS